MQGTKHKIHRHPDIFQSVLSKITSFYKINQRDSTEILETITRFPGGTTLR